MTCNICVDSYLKFHNSLVKSNSVPILHDTIRMCNILKITAFKQISEQAPINEITPIEVTK